LRGFLFLANEGRIRRRHYEEQLNQALPKSGNQHRRALEYIST
jgi:hypothetical protein